MAIHPSHGPPGVGIVGQWSYYSEAKTLIPIGLTTVARHRSHGPPGMGTIE